MAVPLPHSQLIKSIIEDGKSKVAELKARKDEAKAAYQQAMNDIPTDLQISKEGLANIRTLGAKVLEATEAARDFNAAQKQKCFDAIKIPKESRNTLVIFSGNFLEVSRAANKADSFVRDLVHKDIWCKAEIAVDHNPKVTRASCMGVQLNVKSNSTSSTIVHELMHAVEHANVKILAKSFAFLQKRAGSERPKRLSVICKDPRYNDNEVAFEDSWKKLGTTPYAGKVYQNATEVLSVGAERLMQDPIEFAERDPEYFDFILNTLQLGDQNV